MHIASFQLESGRGQIKLYKSPQSNSTLESETQSNSFSSPHNSTNSSGSSSRRFSHHRRQHHRSRVPIIVSKQRQQQQFLLSDDDDSTNYSDTNRNHHHQFCAVLNDLKMSFWCCTSHCRRKINDNEDDCPINYCHKEKEMTEEEAIRKITNGYVFLDALPSNFQSSKAVVTAALELWGGNLQYASDKLKRTESIVLTAIQNHPEAYQYACETLKSNRKFVKKAVKMKGSVLKYTAFAHDKQVAIEAVKSDGLALEFCSSSLRKDADVIHAAVEEDGLAISVLGDEWRNNVDIVRKAVSKDVGGGGTRALQYASEDLQRNVELVDLALERESYQQTKNMKKTFWMGSSTDADAVPECSFSICTKLINVSLPDRIRHVHKQAFAHCTNLKYVKLSSNMKTIHASAFYKCKSLKVVEVPSDVKGMIVVGGCGGRREEEEECYIGTGSFDDVINDTVESVEQALLKAGMSKISARLFHLVVSPDNDYYDEFLLPNEDYDEYHSDNSSLVCLAPSLTYDGYHNSSLNSTENIHYIRWNLAAKTPHHLLIHHTQQTQHDENKNSKQQQERQCYHRYPLFAALSQGINWDEGTKHIYEAWRPAIELIDEYTGMPAFMIAAQNCDLETVWRLLKEQPASMYYSNLV